MNNCDEFIREICENISNVFLHTLQNTEPNAILDNEDFARIRTKVHKRYPDVTDSEILKAILREYTDRLRTI